MKLENFWVALSMIFMFLKFQLDDDLFLFASMLSLGLFVLYFKMNESSKKKELNIKEN